MTTLVVVTGNPAVGKSTIARALADELGWPLIAKDPIKEQLADVLGTPPDRAASQRLGHAASVLLASVAGELVGAGVSVIVESNFPAAAAEGLRSAAFRRDGASGRPLAPESKQAGGSPGQVRVVQVLVECDPAVAAARYNARTRHPVHVLTEIGELPPLPPLDLPGTLLRVDTTSGPVDLTPILEVIVNQG